METLKTKTTAEIFPAEWAPHRATWLAWPAAAHLWEENLRPAQAEFTALCRAIAHQEAGRNAEKLEILVNDAKARRDAELALQGLDCRFHEIPYGDIWLRDTAPLFFSDGSALRARRFAFNGWGGKYALPGDSELSARIAAARDCPSEAFSWVMEGGALEFDGEGSCLTTEQCLLNPNRNGAQSKAEVEKKLLALLGVEKILWIREGLLNDHTDGHIDTLVRFVGPGRVLCMEPSGADDPNAKVLDEIIGALREMKDARGRSLEVVTIPSPGKILDDEGEIMPASYANFYISNSSVIVPTYGSANDAVAVKKIAALFTGRKTVGLSAKAILSGGGAFHCITQQEPTLKSGSGDS